MIPRSLSPCLDFADRTYEVSSAVEKDRVHCFVIESFLHNLYLYSLHHLPLSPTDLNVAKASLPSVFYASIQTETFLRGTFLPGIRLRLSAICSFCGEACAALAVMQLR